MSDLISRQALCKYALNQKDKTITPNDIMRFPSADKPKGMIHIDEVYRLIAGHSNYHGDSILSAFTCLVEGKDVKPIAPLNESADRPKGKWLKSDGTPYGEEPVESCWCSECGKWLVASDEYDVDNNFCPNCGAKMEANDE